MRLLQGMWIAAAFSVSVASQTPVGDPFLRWMDAIAQTQLQAREDSVAQVRSKEAAEARCRLVRARLLQSLGGLPDYSGPLNAKVTGSLQADGYVIEKVIYESLPGYYVTANLYRPDRPGRFPAVLLQSGHTQEGKAEPQLLAANLALKGFVSLAFDPAGQGEREQTYDPNIKGPAAGWSVNEHIQAGAQADLVGESVTRYFIWDAKRSIDYLASRQEVDQDRIGAAGCSGGGALTTFIGALDRRLKAVVPACFPVSYRVLFAGSDPHAEMTLPQQLAYGLDTADFVEVSAPTPWLIQATEQDYFAPAGAKLVYDEARRWYALYGAEDRIALFVGPGPHGTPLVSREAVYQWLIRWLNDGRGDYHEQPARLFPNHDLLVTRTGRVEDEPGARKLFQLILDDLRSKRKQGTLSELAAELRRLKIPTDRSVPAVTVLRKTDHANYRSETIEFESEPGIRLRGELLIPNSPARKPAVLLLSGDRSEPIADRLVEAGVIVLKLEPRSSSSEGARRPFIGDWSTATRADQIGLSLPAMRAHDVLRGIDLLAGRTDVDLRSIRAAGQGVKGIWILLAAAADARIAKVWLDKTPHSFLEALNGSMNAELSDAAIFGFALRWDLEDLVKAMGDRVVLGTDPTNWMGRVVYAGPRFQYRYVLGDLTDRSDAQDDAFLAQFMK